jgi:S-adenosylmethionine synthetase
MNVDYIFTSDSVTAGHPDKLCDKISDAIVDKFLRQDPFSKVIAECAIANGILFISCRFASKARVDITDIARKVIESVGYSPQTSFNAQDCTILASVQDLHRGDYDPVDERFLDDDGLDRIVALNQVNAFGFACEQTPALMPMPIWLAHRLARRLDHSRQVLPYLAPDGQVQVAVEYTNRRPSRIHSLTLLVSHQETGLPGTEQLRNELYEQIVEPVFTDETVKPDAATQFVVNPYGPIIDGGPKLHSGLTGRKNGIDTYGEYARHSGAALSGKDPMRIDRVGAYAARHAAKNIVAAGLASQCEIQLSYSIGLAGPVSISVDTFGTGKHSDDKILTLIKQRFDFRLGAIVRDLNLRHLPQALQGGAYGELAAYGHMGREEIALPWERTDKAESL